VSVFDEDFNVFKLKSPTLANVAATGVLRRLNPLVERGVKLSKPPKRGGLDIHWSAPVKAIMTEMEGMQSAVVRSVSTMMEVEAAAADQRERSGGGQVSTSDRTGPGARTDTEPSQEDSSTSRREAPLVHEAAAGPGARQNVKHHLDAFKSLKKQKLETEAAAAEHGRDSDGGGGGSGEVPTSCPLAPLIAAAAQTEAIRDAAGNGIVADIQHMIRAEVGRCRLTL